MVEYTLLKESIWRYYNLTQFKLRRSIVLLQHEKYETCIETLVQFAHQHGRIPSAKIKNEKALYSMWYRLHTGKIYQREHTQKNKKLLADLGYLPALEKKYRSLISRLIDFAVREQRIPKCYTKQGKINLTPHQLEERRLYQQFKKLANGQVYYQYFSIDDQIRLEKYGYHVYYE